MDLLFKSNKSFIAQNKLIWQCRKKFIFFILYISQTFIDVTFNLFLISPFSIEKVSKISSPVLIIHGTEDEVIDFSHGLALFERCPKAVEPLWVEGAGHNDIELYSQYLERLRRFIGQELAIQHVWPPPTPPPSFLLCPEWKHFRVSSLSSLWHQRMSCFTYCF